MNRAGASPPRAVHAVVALCMVTIVFDGYDLQMLGVIGTSLLAYEPWALTPAAVGAIGSYASVAVLGCLAILAIPAHRPAAVAQLPETALPETAH